MTVLKKKKRSDKYMQILKPIRKMKLENVPEDALFIISSFLGSRLVFVSISKAFRANLTQSSSFWIPWNSYDDYSNHYHLQREKKRQYIAKHCSKKTSIPEFRKQLELLKLHSWSLDYYQFDRDNVSTFKLKGPARIDEHGIEFILTFAKTSVAFPPCRVALTCNSNFFPSNERIEVYCLNDKKWNEVELSQSKYSYSIILSEDRAVCALVWADGSLGGLRVYLSTMSVIHKVLGSSFILYAFFGYAESFQVKLLVRGDDANDLDNTSLSASFSDVFFREDAMDVFNVSDNEFSPHIFSHPILRMSNPSLNIQAKNVLFVDILILAGTFMTMTPVWATSEFCHLTEVKDGGNISLTQVKFLSCTSRAIAPFKYAKASSNEYPCSVQVFLQFRDSGNGKLSMTRMQVRSI